MLNKSCPARVKLLEDETTESGDATGIFEAIVSVFNNVDSYGEMVMPGAFTNTLAAWEERGDPIPVYWSHRMDDPDFNIGHVLEAKETDEGLYVKAQLDLSNAKAKATHNLLRSRRVTQFSFAFNVPPNGMKESEDGSCLELHEINLYEVGPTPIGANPDTELIGVKSGRVLSAKNTEKIKSAIGTLADAKAVLEELLSLTSEEPKTVIPPRKAKTEDPVIVPGKVEEPTATKTIDAILAEINIAEWEGLLQ